MRPPPVNHWEDTLPAEDRARYAAAWDEFRTCRDCRHWSVDEGDSLGACGLERLAAFMTPEDFTCENFEKR